jgi:hypothetical protein
MITVAARAGPQGQRAVELGGKPGGRTMTNPVDPGEEVRALMKRYVAALDSGTRADLRALCRWPLAHVTGDTVRLCDRFPFDPARLREEKGVQRSNVMIDVIHVDGHKAHVLLDGTRCRADGAVVAHVAAVLVLHRQPDGWKIALLSEVDDAPGPGLSER